MFYYPMIGDTVHGSSSFNNYNEIVNVSANPEEKLNLMQVCLYSTASIISLLTTCSLKAVWRVVVDVERFGLA